MTGKSYPLSSQFHSGKIVLEKKQLFIAGIGLLLLLLIFGGVLVWLDARAISRSERLFNEQQASRVASARQALSDYLTLLFTKVEILVYQSVFRGYSTEPAYTRVCDSFAERKAVYPDILSFTYLESPERVVCTQIVGTPAGAEAESLSRQWARTYWAEVSTREQGAFIPPFHIEADFQMFGLLFPVWAGEEFQGLVTVVLDFTPSIQRYITPLQSGQYSEVILIDGRGLVLYAYRLEHLGRSVLEELHVSSPEILAVDRRMLTELSGVDSYVLASEPGGQGPRRLLAWNTVEIQDQKLIIALVAPDIAIAEATYDLRLQRVLLGVALIFFLSAGSLAWFFIRQRFLEQNAVELHRQVELRTAELTASEARYRFLVENAPLGIFVFDKAGALLSMNPAMLQILGCSPDEAAETMAALSLSDLTDLDFSKLIHLYRENTEPVVVERLYESLHGKTVHLRSHVTPIMDPTEDLLGGLALVEDLSRLRHMEDTLQQRSHELSFLHRATQLFSAPSALDQVFKGALEEVRRLLNVFACSIWLVDSDSGDLVCRQATGRKAEVIRGWHLKPGEGLAGWVALHGKSLIVPDVREDARHFNGVAEETAQEMRSILTVPLRVRKQVIGVLQVLDEEVGRFKPGDLLLLEPLAAAVSIAVENGRLFEEEQKQRVLSDALAEAAVVVNSTLDLEQVLDHILEQVARVVPGDAFNIMAVEGTRARVIRWRGYERLGLADLISTLNFPLTRYHNLRVMIEAGTPVSVSDTAADSNWYVLEGWEQLRSYLGAPIKVAGQTSGFLNVDGTRPGQFSAADLERLEAFASHAAIAIEHARLFTASQQRVREMETLQRTSLQITSTLDLPTVLDSIAANAMTLVEATDCHIYLYDEEEGTFTFGAALWRDGRKDPAVEMPRRDGFTAYVAHKGWPVVIDQALQHPLFETAAAQHWGVESIAGFPLKLAGHVLGVFTIAFLEPHTFTQEELRVLTLLADQSATAVENAQLYRQLHEYAEDLEQRVQARTAEIKTQYAQLEAILSSTTDGILVADSAGEIVRLNPVVQLWLTQALSPVDNERFRAAVRELAAQAGKRPVTLLELTGLDLELHAAPIVQPESQELLVVIVVHDVSHLKALDRMKTNFVSNVSHELRTPAATIKLYVELLQRGPADKWNTYLEALDKESAHQAKLVEDILQISRIDAGRLELKLVRTPLETLTTDAVNRHLLVAQERGIQLVHRQMEPEVLVMADSEQMALVFNNLIRNAIQYTPEGGEIDVCVAEVEAEGSRWAKVAIADTGMGIPEPELPRVFERFFRGDRPREMQISGTGLGLALVKNIIELHGGYVTVESQEGTGTTFTVWLRSID
ncbi:MAG: GAF domain-containing protein [Anaerolineae bacterium]|nr:GAF domain-containing protein [Anaerolineae bacterium]